MIKHIATAYVFLAVSIMFAVQTPHGFFMNWFGNQAGEGIEYILLWIGMAAALARLGSGRYSVDSYLYDSRL